MEQVRREGRTARGVAGRDVVDDVRVRVERGVGRELLREVDARVEVRRVAEVDGRGAWPAPEAAGLLLRRGGAPGLLHGVAERGGDVLREAVRV